MYKRSNQPMCTISPYILAWCNGVKNGVNPDKTGSK